MSEVIDRNLYIDMVYFNLSFNSHSMELHVTIASDFFMAVSYSICYFVP
jgi:hypothetical protein